MSRGAHLSLRVLGCGCGILLGGYANCCSAIARFVSACALPLTSSRLLFSQVCTGRPVGLRCDDLVPFFSALYTGGLRKDLGVLTWAAVRRPPTHRRVYASILQQSLAPLFPPPCANIEITSLLQTQALSKRPSFLEQLGHQPICSSSFAARALVEILEATQVCATDHFLRL